MTGPELKQEVELKAVSNNTPEHMMVQKQQEKAMGTAEEYSKDSDIGYHSRAKA